MESLISNFDLRKEDLILDFGCGIGGHVTELRRRGHNINGYDSSLYYIKKAKKLAARKGINLEFNLYHTTDFMKDQSETYDFIFSIEFPLAHIAENSITSLFHSICDRLKMGKKFLFGFTYTRENREKFLPRNQWKEKEGILYLTDERIDDDGKRTERYIIINPKEDTYTEWIDEARYYYLEEIEKVLEMTGFEVVDRFENLDKKEPSTAVDVHFLYCRKIGS